MKSNRKVLFFHEYFEDFLFVLFNFFLCFFVLYPFEGFQNLFLFLRTDVISGYVCMFYPLLTLVYDVLFIVFHSYKARIMEPFNFAKRFLRRSEYKIYQDVEEKGNALFDYIYGAIKNRILLKNDIAEFSMLSSSYIDYRAILDAEKKKKRKPFIYLKNFLFSVTVLEFLFLIISLFVYFFDFIFSTII